MFTGLIQAVGTIASAEPLGQGRRLAIDISGLREPPAVGASVAIDGVCLTVTTRAATVAAFDAVAETIGRTTLREKRIGDRVNLEPALRAGDPLDGHLVQGHVDATARILAIAPRAESQVWRFALPEALRPLVAAKGSVAVDGISLTVVEAATDSFTVSLIPHTLAQTTLPQKRAGDEVNLEADVLARYIRRQLTMPGGAGLSEAFLREQGFS